MTAPSTPPVSERLLRRQLFTTTIRWITFRRWATAGSWIIIATQSFPLLAVGEWGICLGENQRMAALCTAKKFRTGWISGASRRYMTGPSGRGWRRRISLGGPMGHTRVGHTENRNHLRHGKYLSAGAGRPDQFTRVSRISRNTLKIGAVRMAEPSRVPRADRPHLA